MDLSLDDIGIRSRIGFEPVPEEMSVAVSY
jgi:hypothetical protein